jgi:hypothetical protein
MARNENPPFQPGATFGNGNTVAATDGAQYEGKEYVFEDVAPNSPTGTFRTNRYITRRIVRNNSGGALLPKRLGKLSVAGAASQDGGSKVDGYTASPADTGFPIDEYLPAAGVAANDLFYVVTNGPALITSDASGATNFAVGQVVVPGASGTVGKIVTQDPTQTAANLFNQIQNAIGRALAAVNAINTDVLIDVGAQQRVSR